MEPALITHQNFCPVDLTGFPDWSLTSPDQVINVSQSVSNAWKSRQIFKLFILPQKQFFYFTRMFFWFIFSLRINFFWDQVYRVSQSSLLWAGSSGGNVLLLDKWGVCCQTCVCAWASSDETWLKFLSEPDNILTAVCYVSIQIFPLIRKQLFDLRGLSPQADAPATQTAAGTLGETRLLLNNFFLFLLIRTDAPLLFPAVISLEAVPLQAFLQLLIISSLSRSSNRINPWVPTDSRLEETRSPTDESNLWMSAGV